jgi:hypothetical protein
VELEAVGVTEDDLGQGGTTTGVVNDVLHDTTNIAVSLGEIEGTELGRGLVESFKERLSQWERSRLARSSGWRCVLVLACEQSLSVHDSRGLRARGGGCGTTYSEDRATALSLVANNTTLDVLSAHCALYSWVLAG